MLETKNGYSISLAGEARGDGDPSLCLKSGSAQDDAQQELFSEDKEQADPLSRVTGPRMNPSVDVGRPPRPFRHLRMAERCTPDPSSSRAPVHSALVQISVTRHHQPGRPAFRLDAREIPSTWQVEGLK